MNVRRTLGVAALIVLFGVSAIVFVVHVASRPRPSTDDRERLESLRARYGKRLDISFDDFFHVKVRDKTRSTIPISEAKEIFIDYWFDDYSKRQPKGDSRFTNFLFYGKDGNFIFQLYYNSKTGEIEVGQLEFD